MTANLKQVNIAEGTGVYDAVADDGITILQAGISVSGTIGDGTTVLAMKSFVTTHLTNNQATLKAAWLNSQNLTQLNAIEAAWDESVL